MWGGRAMLASAVTQAAINLAETHRMRFGYCEFASTAKLYRQKGGGGADEKDYFVIDTTAQGGSAASAAAISGGSDIGAHYDGPLEKASEFWRGLGFGGGANDESSNAAVFYS